MQQTIIETVNNPVISELMSRIERISEKEEEFSFNILNLSRYGTHLEEFHSDIISQLLDVDGLHNEGDLFLKSFISFLNEVYLSEIQLNWFEDVEVNREDGRIDISIIDNTSKKAIIIENKINGAEDRDNQLDRYYNYLTSEGFEVCCIIYLTLSGGKKSPQLKSTDIMPINLTAFCNSNTDLVNGWLNSLISKCKTIDTVSLLIQYKKLLIFLGYNSMYNKEMKEFYSLSDDMSLVEKIDSLKELTQSIPEYRTDQFVKKITDFKPFERSCRYKTNYILFEKFIEGENTFKIDVWFEENGDAFLHFWNPGKKGDLQSIEKKLTEVSFLDKMVKDLEWVGYSKEFYFSEYRSLSRIDNAIIDFTKELMQALKSTQNN
ncbi:PD-(D/E)XK nuclease family protein [Carboxylicivirga taeanensis]|uniref:PD-(D/E)XK nuclease family protein n=1 Tax=Carboxylicivirga taeanensis TaxID=1416875 RepID=UPI003F6E332A